MTSYIALLRAVNVGGTGKLPMSELKTGPELKAVLANNPYPEAAPNRTVAIFLDEAPASDALDTVRGRKDEQLALGTREIYVHYGEGMGQSKLTIPAAKSGTARNINTISKLAGMLAAR